MKLLEQYFDKLKEGNFRAAHADPIDFFNQLVRSRPRLEDMTDDQVETLIDVLEGVQVYQDDYGQNGRTNAEKALYISFNNMFEKYRYERDPHLDNDNLDEDGEEVYEHLVVRYEKS